MRLATVGSGDGSREGLPAQPKGGYSRSRRGWMLLLHQREGAAPCTDGSAVSRRLRQCRGAGRRRRLARARSRAQPHDELVLRDGSSIPRHPTSTGWTPLDRPVPIPDPALHVRRLAGLLHHRYRFNYANVWQSPGWYLTRRHATPTCGSSWTSTTTSTASTRDIAPPFPTIPPRPTPRHGRALPDQLDPRACTVRPGSRIIGTGRTLSATCSHSSRQAWPSGERASSIVAIAAACSRVRLWRARPTWPTW